MGTLTAPSMVTPNVTSMGTLMAPSITPNATRILGTPLRRYQYSGHVTSMRTLLGAQYYLAFRILGAVRVPILVTLGEYWALLGLPYWSRGEGF